MSKIVSRCGKNKIQLFIVIIIIIVFVCVINETSNTISLDSSQIPHYNDIQPFDVDIFTTQSKGCYGIGW